MSRLTLETFPGDELGEVLERAQQRSIDHDADVEFNFNDITVVVNKNTNLDNIRREYQDAFLMEWNEVGPDCPDSYDLETIEKITQKEKERDERIAEQQAEYAKQRKEREDALAENIKDQTLRTSDQAGWDKVVEINQDPYGKAAVDYARQWALLMQHYIDNGESLIDCADRASHEADTEGITGFMYGAAVNILSQTWEHGEELRQWHNAEYGQPEAKGTVNPAVMSIG